MVRQRPPRERGEAGPCGPAAAAPTGWVLTFRLGASPTVLARAMCTSAFGCSPWGAPVHRAYLEAAALRPTPTPHCQRWGAMAMTAKIPTRSKRPCTSGRPEHPGRPHVRPASRLPLAKVAALVMSGFALRPCVHLSRIDALIWDPQGWILVRAGSLGPGSISDRSKCKLPISRPIAAARSSPKIARFMPAHEFANASTCLRSTKLVGPMRIHSTRAEK